LEEWLNNDFKQYCTNLFVEPAFANIIESHTIELQKEIEKLELKIRETQNAYKKLKNEEVIINV